MCSSDLEEAEEIFILEKSAAINRIIKCLGATKKDFKLEINQISTVEYNINADIDYKINADINYNNSETKRLSKHISTVLEFTPSPLSAESYEEAKRYAEKYNLNNNTHINSLLELRDPESIGSEEKYYEINTTISSELNSALDIAIGLKAMNGLFSFKSSFNKIVSERKDIQLQLKISF